MRALDADRFADLVQNRAARRAERGSDDCRHDRYGDRQPKAMPLGRDRLPCGERVANDGRRALAGVVLAGDLDVLELALHSSSASASSPRRSREFTVPRGRSSVSAISPGVKSSR